MEKTLLDSINAPCFSCPYCYNCRYWQNDLWTDWILANNECPAKKYTLDSIYYVYISYQKKKKEDKTYRWDEFSKKSTV